MKPRYKLIRKVDTAEYRRMVREYELQSSGWRSSYRRPGNTVAVRHESATLALFGHGDAIYLCASPEREVALRQERAR